MARFMFAYHGGKMPETEEEVSTVISKWNAWLEAISGNVVDGGNPVGQSSTVESDGSITPNGGSNPLSGYSIVEAESMEAAIELARGCPILLAGGSVEVAMIHEIG